MLLCWSCCSELCLRCCHFPNKVGIPNDNYILNSRAPRSSWLESHLRRRDWAWNGDTDSYKYWMVTWSLWETAQCRSFSSRLWSCGNNLVQSNDMNDTINLDVLLKTTCSLLRRLQTVFGWGCQQSMATIEGELQSGATWADHIGVIVVVGLVRYRNLVALPVRLFDRQLFTGLCGADYKVSGLFLVIDIQIITSPPSFK